MKAALIEKPGGEFQIVDRAVPKPSERQVRIKVQACGICRSDSATVDGVWPGLEYPRVPGHEIVGVIDELGADVTTWRRGQRVGVGWHGGHDNTCLWCRRGDFRNCKNLRIPGISYDGGYQQYMVAPIEALVALPDNLNDVDIAPLLCAGITTYNALRHAHAMAGDLVAVLGIGGLGHLGVQFANKMGFRVAAIGRGPGVEALAKQLGAHVYIDSKATNAAAVLQDLGGAQAILGTVPSSKAMSELVAGLAPNGELLVIGADVEPLTISPVPLLTRSQTIQGWASGTPADTSDTLRFAELSGVRAMIETIPLAKVREGYARMLNGQARFRMVLTM